LEGGSGRGLGFIGTLAGGKGGTTDGSAGTGGNSGGGAVSGGAVGKASIVGACGELGS